MSWSQVAGVIGVFAGVGVHPLPPKLAALAGSGWRPAPEPSRLPPGLPEVVE